MFKGVLGAKSFALLAGTSVILAGCGSQPTVTSAGGAPLAPGTSSASGLVSHLVSPLNYFANGPGFTADAQQTYESSIAACMQERGWAYTPRTDSLIRSDPSTVAELGAYRKTAGYAASSVAPNGTGTMPTSKDPATAQNAAYAASLSPSAQLRYVRDLAGGTNEAAPVDPNPSGCQPRALKALKADLPIQNPAFGEAWSESVKSILRSEEYMSAIQAWRSCMAASGFAVEDPDQAPALALKDTQKSVGVAGSDFDCQVSVLLPVKQRLEQTQVATLVARFPEYAARAAQLN